MRYSSDLLRFGGWSRAEPMRAALVLASFWSGEQKLPQFP